MKLFKPGLALIGVVCLVLSAQGATLFSDNFSDTNQTKIKWNNYVNQLKLTYAIGNLTIQNPDTIYTGFLTKIFGSKPSTYTLTISFKAVTNSNGAGLMHCLNSASMTGYSCQFNPGKNVYAFAGATTLANQDAGFGAATTYEVTVSKSGTTCNIFCNGKYVTKYDDAVYNSGDIAILVPPKSTIQVTNVLMTDQFTEGSPITFFADTFKVAGPDDGWNIGTMVGSITSGSGSCVLNDTSATSSSMIYVRGDFSKGSLKGVVSHVRGTGLYGITFLSVLSNGNSISYKNYSFAVDSLRNYAIIYPDSNTIRSQPGPLIYGALGTDTIEVLRYAKKYVLKINGEITDSAVPIPTSYRIDAVGLYVGAKTSAKFNLFAAGGDSLGARPITSALLPSIRNTLYSPLPAFGNGSIVYDIMGRKIGSFTRVGFNKAEIKNGPYIVWTPGMNGTKGYATKVMKVNTR